MKVDETELIRVVRGADSKLLALQTKHIGDLIRNNKGRKDYLEGLWEFLHGILDCEVTEDGRRL